MKLEDLERLLEEMLGAEIEEVSIVDQPATDRPFKLFKRAGPVPAGRRDGMAADPKRLGALLKSLGKAVPEGVDRATFDRCVDHIIQRVESGELSPRDPDADPKSVGFAICTAMGAGAGGKGAKQEPGEEPVPGAEEMPPPPTEAAAAETVEIPASPTKWTFVDCIADASDMGFDQDSAISVCQILRQDFGDPSDEETILVPDGSSPEAMLASAAVHGGIAKPEGLEAPPPEQALRFSGKNQWTRKFRRFLGIDRAPTVREREDARLKREVKRLVAEQAKTKDDLREMIALLRETLFASLRAQGIDLPAAGSVVPPAAGVEPAKTDAGATLAEAAGIAADPAKRVKELEAEVARLNGLIEAKPGSKATEGDESEGEDQDPGSIVPNPGTAPVLADVAPAAVANQLLRKSIDPKAGGNGRTGQGENVYSTYLNAWIPRADREAVAKRGR